MHPSPYACEISFGRVIQITASWTDFGSTDATKRSEKPNYAHLNKTSVSNLVCSKICILIYPATVDEASLSLGDMHANI